MLKYRTYRRLFIMIALGILEVDFKWRTAAAIAGTIKDYPIHASEP